MPSLHLLLVIEQLCWIDQVELKEGPLEQFTHEMEPFLRKQGMPVRLNKGLLSHHFQFPSLTQYTTSLNVILMIRYVGTVELLSDFVVCEEGKPLSPESSRILVNKNLYYQKPFILVFVL